MKRMRYLPAVLIALLALSVTAQQPHIKLSPRQKLAAIETAIANYYVDSVDENRLVEDAIRGMLDNLDPHSSYSTREETAEFNTPLEGNFSGVGIQFNMQKDTLYVIQIIAGGPAEKVGIQPGDRFLTVNDTTIAGVQMKNSDIMKRLRGPKGSIVTVTVKRRGVQSPITFRITRDDIPVYSIDAAYMADSRTGYIRLSRFARTSMDEYREAFKKLKRQGMKQLVLDLTSNGGGYLDIAAELANEFLSRGEMIVYTEGRRRPRSDIRANGSGDYKDGRLVIMVDQFSASASEILSGAVQDWDRAVIVGRRTFGKGLVQQKLDLPDSTMVRLTVARYYTPSGRCIQKPYKPGDKEDYERDLLERYNHGEFMTADSTVFADSLKCRTLRNGRTVYGGGGIMPDVFVPLDTATATDYYRDLVAKGIFNQFVVHYVDKNRDALKARYADIQAFDKGFTVSDSLMQQLVDEGIREGVPRNDEQYARSEALLRDMVKAVIARDLYDTSAYFYIANRRNPIYNEAMDVINSKSRYESLLGE